MGISVNTSKQQIEAKVAEDKITATVSAGFGAVGPQGPTGDAGLPSGVDGQVLTYSSGVWVAANLPSYVDDVVEYANLASLPVTGETGKIYVAINTGKIYRWSGSAYFEISTPPANTDAVPEGSSNLYFTNARARNAFGTATNGQVIAWSGGQWAAATPETAYAALIHSHSTADITNFTAAAAAAAPVASVNGSTGTIVLTNVSVSAASAVHTHSTTDIVAFTASASAAAPVQSVAGRTGAISLAAADVSGLASVATSGSYTSLSNVPTTFTPATHTHATSDITGFDAAAAAAAPVASVNGKTGTVTLSTIDLTAAAATHTHAASDVTSGTFDLARIPTIGYTALSGVPTTFTPSSHTHSPSAITFAATDRLLGRATASGGEGEEITCTAAGRAILDDADAAAQRTTLSAQKTITSGTAAPTGGSDGDIYLQYA